MGLLWTVIAILLVIWLVGLVMDIVGPIIHVLLVIEVADSSLEHDRSLKLPAYAASGIPECWLITLPEQQVEVYREPVDGEYRLLRLCRSGDTLELLAFPGAALAVSQLLGEGQPEPPPEPAP